MTKKVEIYSRSNCSYCDMAKNFFDSKASFPFTAYRSLDIYKDPVEHKPK